MPSSVEPQSEAPTAVRARRIAWDASVAALAALLVLLALSTMGWPWDWMSLDARGAHLPRNEHAARSMLEGRLPLWNPYELAGMPLMATTTGAMLYPPVVVAHALLEPRTAFAALALLHLFLLFLGTTLYLGRHGSGRPLAIFAAAVALGPAFAADTVHYPNYLAALSWVPLLLFLLDRAIDAPGWRPLGAFALAAAMQWLAGYPDYPMDTAVLLGAVTLFGRPRPLLRPCLVLVAGLALGGAIAAVQLLPLAEMVGESHRATTARAVASSRALFAVQSLEHGVSLLGVRYGIAFLALGCAGVSLRSDVRRGWLVAFVWCSLALNAPFVLLYRLAPWSGSRAPTGWLGLAPLLLGFLAAAGLRRVMARRSRWLGALGVALAAGALLHGRQPVLEAYGRVVVPPEPESTLVQRAEQIRAHLEGPARGARILAWPERLRGSFLRHGLASPTGYEPSQLEPRRVAQLLGSLGLHLGGPGPRPWAEVAAHPDLAALLGVGIVVGPPQWLRELRQAGFVEIGALPGRDRVLYRPPVPRARLVHHATVVPDEAASLARVVAHAAEARTTAVLTADQPLPELAEPPGGAEESATIAVDQPERIEVAARVASPALLVLRDTEYPGWRATVDAAPAAILRVDHAFRGVALPPGEHRVVLVYDPASVRIGLAVSGVGLAIAAALMLLGGRPARPRACRAAIGGAAGAASGGVVGPRPVA